MSPRTVIAVDPGLATGIAVVSRSDDDVLVLEYSGELPPLDAAERFRELLGIRFPESEVVVERFTITSATAKNSQAPWSLKVIGALEWIAWDTAGLDPEREFVLQGPAEAKRLVTNEMLRRFGLWHRGGEGHANDAIRHAVYRYARLGWRRPWEETLP